MALSHVDRAGYPAAIWKYLISATMLGRPWALYAANAACLVSLGILGRFSSPGVRDILQSLGPVASHQLLSTAVPCLFYKMTASRVQVDARSVSHSGTSPIKVLRNPGIRNPFECKF